MPFALSCDPHSILYKVSIPDDSGHKWSTRLDKRALSSPYLFQVKCVIIFTWNVFRFQSLILRFIWPRYIMVISENVASEIKHLGWSLFSRTSVRTITSLGPIMFYPGTIGSINDTTRVDGMIPFMANGLSTPIALRDSVLYSVRCMLLKSSFQPRIGRGTESKRTWR